MKNINFKNRIKNKKDVIISFVLLFIFLYIFITPFLIKKYQGIKIRNILKNNKYIDWKSGVTIHDQKKLLPGLTIFTTFGGHVDENNNKNHSILININGEIINEWKILGFPAQLFSNGNVLGSDKFCNYFDEDTHQESCSVVELDWEGNEVWKFDKWEMDKNNNYISRSHHDIQRANYSSIYSPSSSFFASSSGRTLILSHQTSLNKNINVNPLEDDVLLEVSRDGSILWKWVASDHFEEFGFTEPMKKAIFNMKFVKNKFLNRQLFYPNNSIDWLHLNSASYLGPNLWYDKGDKRFSPENIMISSRNGCFVAIIDKETGKIVWRIGPDYKNESERLIGQIIGQHDAYIIPKGLPGEGNVIMFDNGGFSCFGTILGRPTFPTNFREYSRIVEINPVTLEVIWEYSQPEQNDQNLKFFSWAMGSVQRLSNGNTLIAEGVTGRIFEVTREKEIVWEYFFPLSNKSKNLSNLGGYIYNAYRYPNEFILKDE